MNDHIPTWKNVIINILLGVFTPVLAFIVFDMPGGTEFILDKWGSHGKVDPSQFNRMINSIFHSGVTHIFACASLHFFYNSIIGIWCILFHKHKSGFDNWKRERIGD
ncbi:hypothetical protein KAR91_80995 [Candidatus Pacearchaeota archaeon]|nr:hypothetical protein [Candidatus Pacearchaeota archaeon]